MRILPEVRLGICADEFGLAGGVNAAVSELAWQSRLSATSCVVDGPVFAGGAQTLGLLRRAGMLDVGLHLDLTSGLTRHWPRTSIGGVLARSFGARSAQAALHEEVRRQLDRFEQVLGFAPDHVDGHRHVHLLPGVRRVLLEELQERTAGPLPWVRRVPSAWLAGRQLVQRGFASNRGLLPLSRPASNVEQSLQRLAQLVRQARDGDLLLCHPATPPRSNLLFATGRHAEYRVLASQVLPAVLAEHRVRLVRPSQWLQPRPVRTLLPAHVPEDAA